jgi:hypothetical protein
MSDRIYDDVSLTNPNNRALVVPPQEGGTIEDGYFGSIGDATARHVTEMAQFRPADRQLWEDLISTRTGKIWRTQPSTAWHDPDPFGLRGKDLEQYLKRALSRIRWTDNTTYELTESEKAVIEEAFEVEAERQDESRDVYDRCELIPYDQMEKFPGMMKHIDVPTTPKDWLIFMGNTNDIFYDEFPDGHPDQGLIRLCLQKLNKPWIDITVDYAEWFCEWIQETGARAEVVSAMSWLVYNLAKTGKDPIETTREALESIDAVWQREYKIKGLERFRRDPIWDLLKVNEEKWEGEAKEGKTAYPSIRAFGRLLFQEYRNVMRAHHWELYRKIRDSHAPKVFLKGININKASLSDLRRVLNLPSRDPSRRMCYTIAEEVWHKRPFESLGHLKREGLIDHKVFAEDEKSDELLVGMEKATDTGKTRLSIGPLNEYRKTLIETQRQGKKINWSPIWSYYHLLKAELSAHIKEQEDEQRRADEERPGPGLHGDPREDREETINQRHAG